MSSFDLAARVRAGKTAIMAWVGLTDPVYVETIGRLGFDAVNLDMQHGLHDTASVLHAIGGLVATGTPAMVRVPVGDFAMASRALDMGAAAVIAPMINTAADARAFADAMKYPPIGKRSWGPTRAMALKGESSAARYLAGANLETLALAMIETPEALENLEAILDVDGIDGVLVGPSDLSLTLSGGTMVDGNADIVSAPIRRIVEVTLAKGKVPSIFTISGAKAREAAALGYRIISVGIDTLYIAQGAATMLREARS